MPSPSALLPPTASNSVFVTGTVLFVATLSPSFTLFALDVVNVDNNKHNNNNNNNKSAAPPVLDVVLKIKKTTRTWKNKNNPSQQHSNHHHHQQHQQQQQDDEEHQRLRRVRAEVQRCYTQGEPVTVHGWDPLEPCPCRQYNNNNDDDDDGGGGGGGDCPHAILHCWNVNDLPVTTPPPITITTTTTRTTTSTPSTDETHHDHNHQLEQQQEPPTTTLFLESYYCQPAAAAVGCSSFSPPATSTAAAAAPATTSIINNEDKNKPRQQQQQQSKNSTTKRPAVRAKVHNGARAARFVDALLEVMGPHLYDISSSSGVVLDVAGGGSGGGVTFELSLRRHIASTIIDPRPVQWNAARRRTLHFREAARAQLMLQPHYAAAAIGRSHQAAVLAEQRFRPWKVSQRCERFPTVQVQEHWERIEAAAAADGEGDDDDNHSLLRLVTECRAIVGLHPDEATDAIIHTALRYRKPWAVVPCCVFPNTFTDRTLHGGKSVRTYDDLCAYIQSVAHGVKEITLDFEGRNKMYYWIPEELCQQQSSS